MMEFEDEDRDEEEEEDDDDNNNEPEPETMSLLITPPTYHHHHNNNNSKKYSAVTVTVPRYRECLKNHAVNIGGHAVDGCGEFMPAGPDGTFDALKCAACNCHRNFHRKEHVSSTADNHRQLSLFHPPPPHVYQFYRPAVPAVGPTGPTGPTAGVAAGVTAEEQVTGGMMAMTMTTTTTNTTSSGKKRHRTKFSQEQKDKMLGLAESLGWKIQKCDENVVQQFCDESGVKRHVLKVWMHNNKHTLGKKLP